VTVRQLIEELKKHDQNAKVVQSSYYMAAWQLLEVDRVAETTDGGRDAVILHLHHPS
jgi:hypothetical protein